MAVLYRIQNPKNSARNQPKFPMFWTRPLAAEAAMPQDGRSPPRGRVPTYRMPGRNMPIIAPP